MTRPGERERFLDRPENVRVVLRVLYAVCALVVSLDVVHLAMYWLDAGELRHAHREWEGFPGFYAAFGFIACVTLVLVAKQMRRVLMRGEDYYER